MATKLSLNHRHLVSNLKVISIVITELGLAHCRVPIDTLGEIIINWDYCSWQSIRPNLQRQNSYCYVGLILLIISSNVLGKTHGSVGIRTRCLAVDQSLLNSTDLALAETWSRDGFEINLLTPIHVGLGFSWNLTDCREVIILYMWA